MKFSEGQERNMRDLSAGAKPKGLLFELLRFLPNPPAKPPVTVEDWELRDLLPPHQIREIMKGQKK
jgi:hypothetical protein